MRGGEAGAGANDAPTVGAMQAEVPRAGAAHREAAQHEALAVEHVAAAQQPLDGDEVIDRLPHVGLAGPAIGVVAAAIDVDPDEGLVLGGGLLREGTQERYLRQRGIATVQHHVHAPLLRAVLAIIGRQGHGVGLE